MKIDELIKELQKYEMDKEVIVFTEGNLYPTKTVNYIEDMDVVEIGCGWAKLDDEEDNFNYEEETL